jgi:hypothetical protein
MSDSAVLFLFFGFVALTLIGGALYLASGLLVIFAIFVMGLPTLVAVLLFILFPPAFLAFLGGYFLMLLGYGSEKQESDGA